MSNRPLPATRSRQFRTTATCFHGHGVDPEHASGGASGEGGANMAGAPARVQRLRLSLAHKGEMPSGLWLMPTTRSTKSALGTVRASRSTRLALAFCNRPQKIRFAYTAYREAGLGLKMAQTKSADLRSRKLGEETITVSMVAAVVAAVLSATLNVVANKLAPLVIKQYSSVVGVTKDLEELKDLVKEVNCLLVGVGYEAVGNDPPLDWLRKLKDIAYTVDDVVDEFQLKAEEHDASLAAGGGIIFNMLIKPKSFIFQCKAARKVKKIKKEFAAIVKKRTDVSAIVNSLPPGQPVRLTTDTVVGPSLPIVNEALVLGRDKEKKKIMFKLVEDCDQQEIKVVSIIGLGGSGKTTLAKLVFNDDKIIEKHFEVRLWVHVSQEFDVQNKLVKKLFEAISNENSESHSIQHMIKKISNKLTKNRFLLVLDDVWTENRFHWETFMEYVKDGAPGSKILLTTRNRNVAEAVECTTTNLFNLPFLSNTYSWQVFQQSFGIAVKDLDPEFLEVGKDIVNKCGGVPLAIKVLAGVLRVKKRIEQWHAVRENNLLYAEDKERQVSACLSLSYYSLPSYLKPCFTICSLFPKGHLIHKEQLIDQWIAHDMISLEVDVNYLENTGDDYFNYLVQMGFLQDVDEKNDGRVKCRMHDLVHDLSRSILGDEISLAVPIERANLTKVHRYFSLMEQTRHPPPKNTFEKARSMYVVQGYDFIFGKALENAKHLRSVTVQSVPTQSSLRAILQIKNLRYLNVSGLKCKRFPVVISDIWGLEALHVSSSHLVELPESIGKLHKLRVVHLSYCSDLERLPDAISNCHMISSIDIYSCKKLTTLPNSISGNIHLRVLRLARTGIERLPSSITILENLECLDLCWCSKLVELPEGIGNLKKLVVLNLQGCGKLEAMPIGIGHLTRLRKLGLFAVRGDKNCAQISELGNVNRIGGKLIIHGIPCGMDPNDGQACLKEKTNLQCLKLFWRKNIAANIENEVAVLDGLEPPSGIRSLKVSGYAGSTYAQWMLQQVSTGAAQCPRFPWLRRLELSDSPNLKHLRGLVELPRLEKLVLSQMPALESISGGPFPALVDLVMREMYSLGVVWVVSGNLADDVQGGGSRQVTVGSRLPRITIDRCPRLRLLPCLPFSLGYGHWYQGNKHDLEYM